MEMMCRINKKLWGTGEMVIMNSGFYLLKGLTDMCEMGVYVSEVVKKRRYRP